MRIFFLLYSQFYSGTNKKSSRFGFGSMFLQGRSETLAGKKSEVCETVREESRTVLTIANFDMIHWWRAYSLFQVTVTHRYSNS